MEPIQAADPATARTPEQEVADVLAIEADPLDAQRLLDEVPFWFHTFALNRAQGTYTPGSALDHRYRLASLPADYSGLSVLDVGTFDGFYAFVAERRGAERVLAIDNEQYVAWVKARWGHELEGGEGFEAIAKLLDSKAEYLRLDAFDLDRLEEQFDLICCFGILHRVGNPHGLLRRLGDRLNPGGRVLLETLGVPDDDGSALGAVRVPDPGEIYPGDEYVFWEFTSGSIARLGRYAGFGRFDVHDMPLVDGHPRIIGALSVE